MKSVLKGVEKHLASPIPKMRTLGMIVGEILMNQLNEDKKEEKKLKFEVRKKNKDCTAKNLIIFMISMILIQKLKY